MEISSDDLIYNRFDIIYPNEYEEYKETYKEKEYIIQMHLDNHVAELNLWGRNIPDDVVEHAMSYWENRYKSIYYFKITRATDNIKNVLVSGKEYILSLPDDEDDLVNRLNSKERQTIKRKWKQITQKGCLSFIDIREIPESIVNRYFDWKFISHGTNYRLTAEEYIKKYHVTNAIYALLKTETEELPIAILFYCRVNQIVYFENFSYNQEYAKYSPGYLVYIQFLRELQKNGVNTVYLGGGDYSYKKKFDTLQRECYSGEIFTKEGYSKIKKILNNRNIALYGMGNVGKSVLYQLNEININVQFCIDKKRIEKIDKIECYTADEEWPICDLIIITIKNKISEVENLIKARGYAYLYWSELIESIR